MPIYVHLQATARKRGWLIYGNGLSNELFSKQIWGVTGFLGSLKISLSEERRLKDTHLKCEDRRFQNCLVLKSEDLATKLTKPDD